MTKDQMETKKTVWYIKVNNPYEKMGIRAYWARSKDEADTIASVLQRMHKWALINVSAEKPHDLYGKALDWRLSRHERDMWDMWSSDYSRKIDNSLLGYDYEITYRQAPAQHLNRRMQRTYHNETWLRKGRIFYCYSRDYKLTRYGKAIEKAYIEEVEKDHIEEVEKDHIEEVEKDQIKENDMTKDLEKVQEAFNNGESVFYDRADGVMVVASYIAPDATEPESYVLTYHRSEMPPFTTDTFTSMEMVIETMRKIAPLAQWKTFEEEEDKGDKEKMSTVHLHPCRTETDYVYERDDSLLVSDIIKTIAKNEEGPRVRKLDNGIRVYTRNSQHPELNFNGGDYDHFTNFVVEPDGHVIAFEGWSSDFDYGCVDTVVYGMHTVAELHAIADSLVLLVEIIEQELRNRLS